MGPIALSFGLASAAVFVIAALFSTRHNIAVAGFLAFIWVSTNVVDLPTGSDGQLYMDTILGLLCGLLCVVAMHNERKSAWPVLILATQVLWIITSAIYAGNRDAGPQVKYADQLASNVLLGVALLIAAVPGGKHGTRVLRHWLPVHPGVRIGVHHPHRTAQEKAERRRLKVR